MALVFARSVEIDVEKGLRPGLHNGALVKAKLLVPSQFANSLIGNGNREAIIATGADVQIPVGDQILEWISENEVVIEVKCLFSCNQCKLFPLRDEKIAQLTETCPY